MKSLIFPHIMAFAMLLLLFSCDNNEKEDPNAETYDLSGYAQKGPFAMGSQILIGELDSALVPTGRTFSTQIQDNSGKYALEGVSLLSQFVQVRVDGFYFNEVSGGLSETQISLSGIMDLSQSAQQNLNIMTHLEQYRIQYLVGQGTSFETAKNQAHNELMQIFDFAIANISQSELLDIAEEGEDHAMLLAASLILQGKRSTAELSEFINLIGSDIAEDGTLDNTDLGTQLINDASILNPEEIRSNIEQRYAELGMDRTIANFEPYLQHFIENTTFERTNEITFPAMGNYGANALHPSITQVENERITGRPYSFAVEVPEKRSFMVRTSGGLVAYTVGSEINLTNYAEWEPVRFSTYTSTASGHCDVRIIFNHVEPYPRIVLLEYFADGNTEPFLTKELEIVDVVVPDN